MKTKPRWIKSVIATAKTDVPSLALLRRRVPKITPMAAGKPVPATC